MIEKRGVEGIEMRMCVRMRMIAEGMIVSIIDTIMCEGRSIERPSKREKRK